MEPVRVVCPSCRGKLIVRMESLLGQVVVCPRCKSNVQIPASPPPTPAIATPTFDSSAITRVDDGLLAQRLAEESEKVGGLFDLDGQSFESAIDAFRPANEDLVGSKSSESKAGKAIFNEHVPLEPLAPDDAIPASRMADWNPPETMRRRQILVIAMTGLAATLVALGGLVAFLNIQSSKTSMVQKPPIQQETVQPSEKPVEAVAPNDTKPDASEMKSDHAIAGEPPVAIPIEPPTTTIVEPIEKPPANLQANSFENMFPNKAPPVVGEKEVDVPEPSTMVPQSLDIPESMLKFNQIFDPGSVRLLPDAITNEKPSAGAEVGAEKVDIETFYHPSPTSVPPWEIVRSTRVQSLTTSNPTSINSLLLLLGQLSGSGFSWDIDSVRMSGFDIDRPITLSVEATTVGDILDGLCSEHGLVSTRNEKETTHLSPNLEDVVNRLPSDWSIDDLATQEGALAAWQALIHQLYPAWSNEWSLEGASIKWTETASALHRATVAAFLDQVRIAHGLMPKSTLPESVTDPRLGLDASLVPLSKVGTRIIEHPLSVPQILDVAARDSGLKILYDWESLFSHGFAHSRAATSLLRGRTWPEIAKWGMDEFSLVAVVDGNDRIILTTLPRQRHILRTVVLRLESGKTLDSVRDSLRILSPTDDSGRSMLFVGSLPQVGDEKNSWTVARICPPNTIQLQIRSLREALRLPALTKNKL